ncbi:MAG: apolipoprotein A1/A4/E family protein [Lewinellaceae bacterium]|nr:apolipoprotein A1/A4/E family protein [Lewinellaceae bacterium]
MTSDIAKKGVAAVASTVKDTAQVVATTGVAAINMAKSGAEEVGEFASDTASAALNLPSQAIDLTEDVVEDIMSVGETVLKATLDLGDEIIEFTIDTVDKLADCIELIIEKVVDTVDKIIDYLKDLFNWQDIIDTHDLMVRYFNSTLDLLRQRVIPDMEVKIDNLLSSIEDKIIGYLDEMIDDFGAGANATESDGKSVGDEVMDKLHWFMDKIFGDEASDSTSTSNGDSGLGTAEEQEGILSVLEELKNKLAGLLDQYGAKIIDTFIDGIETMASAVTAGKDAGKRLIGGLLTIAKALMQTGFAIVKALIAILLKLFKAVITLFQQACNAKIDIPFISDLYKTATNSDLTILSIASLLIAAPTTIICKIAFGKPPKEMIAPAANSLSIGWAQFLSIAYGTTHLALGILETMNDIANVRKEVDVPGLKSKKPQQVNVQNGANVTSNTAGQNAVIQNVRVNINTTYGPPPPPPSTAATPTKTPWMSASDPSHLLPVLVMILGIFTQGFGLPVKGMSHNSGNSGSDPNKTKGDTEPIESASGNTERASNTMNSDSSNLGSATNATDSNASNSGSATNPPNNDPNTPITAPENSAVSDESRILNFSFDNFKDGVASSVWIYQWLYTIISAADWAVDKWAPDDVKKIIGPRAKYLTTGLGVVHLGLQGWQIVLDVLATPDGGAEKTKLAFRSLASAVSVAPNIGKVLFLSNINLACKGIPILVGTGCNSLGHLIEGSIFIARGIYKDV